MVKVNSDILSEDFVKNFTALISVHNILPVTLSLINSMWKEPSKSKLTDLLKYLKYLESMFGAVYLIASEIKQLRPAAKLI